MKSLLTAFVASACCTGVALGQDALSLYHWEAVPKRLVLNPAAPVSHRAWLSLPVIGHADLAVELPWAVTDAIDLRGNSLRQFVNGEATLDIGDLPIAVPEVIAGLEGVGQARVTARVNLLSAGVRTTAGLFSVHLDQQLDLIGSSGPTPLQGLYFGEAFVLQRGVSAAGIAYDASVRQTLSLGYQREIADGPWRIGGNLKVTRTQAHLRLIEMDVDVAEDVEGAEVTFRGRHQVGGWRDVFDEETGTEDLTPRRLFAGGNVGIGVDLGAHYRPDERLELSASLTDVGFLRLGERSGEYGFVNSLRVGESQPLATRELVTVELFADEAGELGKDGRDSLTNADPYLRPSPGALYLGGQYRFGGDHSVGLVTRTTLRGGRFQNATAVSLNVRPWRFLEANTSVSYSNVGGVGVGFGASLQLAVLQVYAGTDDVIGLANPVGARRVSAVAGVTLLLPEKRERTGPGRMKAGEKSRGRGLPCPKW